MFDDDLDAQVAGIVEQLEYVRLTLWARAETLAEEANRAMSSVDRRAIRFSALGMSARRREGFWGPRLVWVKVGPVRGKKSASLSGTRKLPRSTRELPMPDGLRVHLNYFEALDEPVREIAIDYEHRAREIRLATRVFRETYLGSVRIREAEEAGRAERRRSGSGLVREV